MRCGVFSRPNVSAKPSSSRACVDVSASRRPSASRAFCRALSVEVLLLAALRHRDRDLVAGARRQGLGEQSLFLDRVRKQDQTRARLVVVELGEERTEHFARLQRRVGLGEVGAVAPVLPGAEEEHLDAVLPAFLVDGEDVGLFHRLRVDALVALHVRKGREAVAIDGGALEVERLRRLLHRCRYLRLHALAAARQEILRLLDQFGVVVGGDLAGAGAEQRLIW